MNYVSRKLLRMKIIPLFWLKILFSQIDKSYQFFSIFNTKMLQNFTAQVYTHLSIGVHSHHLLKMPVLFQSHSMQHGIPIAV